MMTEPRLLKIFALTHAAFIPKVISWSKMATGVPSIASEFQPLGRRKGQRRSCSLHLREHTSSTCIPLSRSKSHSRYLQGRPENGHSLYSVRPWAQLKTRSSVTKKRKMDIGETISSWPRMPNPLHISMYHCRYMYFNDWNAMFPKEI